MSPRAFNFVLAAEGRQGRANGRGSPWSREILEKALEARGTRHGTRSKGSAGTGLSGSTSRARPGTALCFRVPGPPPTGRNPGMQSRRQPRASGQIFGRRLLGTSEIIFTHGEKNDVVF